MKNPKMLKSFFGKIVNNYTSAEFSVHIMVLSPADFIF